MDQLDAYYRALQGYRRETAARRDCARDARACLQADAAEETISVARTRCVVDEEWVRAIEEGLLPIEKAIRQERQFIHSQGEVFPIEKIKRTSKESVQHLARHSDFISRQPEDGNLVPDRLYAVERESDYAVYENRFLYMLLRYLQDFVRLRYDRVLELTNRYEGRLTVRKEIVSAKHRRAYRVELQETRDDDDYMRAHNDSGAVIDRMDLILKTIGSLLATPLMERVSKVAALKPPITKTNAMRMDNDFKQVVALYEFIVTYDRDGYTVEREERALSPFEGDAAEDLAEAELLLSFLTREYGLGMRPELQDRYEREEQERKLREIRRRNERIEAMRRRLAREGGDPDEYVLALEDQLRLLQNENARVEPLRRELARSRETEAALRAEAEGAAARAEEFRRVADLGEQARARDREEFRLAREAELAEIGERHERDLAAQREAHAAEADALREQVRRGREERGADERTFRETVQAREAELSELQARLAAAVDERRLSEARVLALLAERDGLSEEERERLTGREPFCELEREYEQFTRFYRSQWRRTKRRIRRNLLSPRNLRGDADGRPPRARWALRRRETGGASPDETPERGRDGAPPGTGAQGT